MDQALINELRATARACRETVEGPTVKMESKQQLRRLVTLAEKAANVMAAETKPATKPSGKDPKGDDSKGAEAQG
jgi:hypothetical protein